MNRTQVFEYVTKRRYYIVFFGYITLDGVKFTFILCRITHFFAQFLFGKIIKMVSVWFLGLIFRNYLYLNVGLFTCQYYIGKLLPRVCRFVSPSRPHEYHILIAALQWLRHFLNSFQSRQQFFLRIFPYYFTCCKIFVTSTVSIKY